MAEPNDRPPEMVYRLMKAIAFAFYRDEYGFDYDDGAWAEDIAEKGRLYRRMLAAACAALKEMREPTDGMIEYAADALEQYGGDYKDAWRYMIDAALTE